MLLYRDILRVVCDYLTIAEILSFSLSCKEYYTKIWFDDEYYQLRALKLKSNLQQLTSIKRFLYAHERSKKSRDLHHHFIVRYNLDKLLYITYTLNANPIDYIKKDYTVHRGLMEVALLHGQIEIVKLLFSLRTSTQITYNKKLTRCADLLYSIAANGHLDSFNFIISNLTELGVNLDRYYYFIYDGLLYAKEHVSPLLKRTKNIAADKYSIFLRVTSLSHTHIRAFILSDVASGLTFFHKACYSSSVEIVKYLIERYVMKSESPEKYFDDTYLIAANKDDKSVAPHTKIAKRENIPVALRLSIKGKNIEVLRYLMCLDPQRRIVFGLPLGSSKPVNMYSLFYYSIEFGSEEIIEYLLQYVELYDPAKVLMRVVNTFDKHRISYIVDKILKNRSCRDCFSFIKERLPYLEAMDHTLATKVMSLVSVI